MEFCGLNALVNLRSSILYLLQSVCRRCALVSQGPLRFRLIRRPYFFIVAVIRRADELVFEITIPIEVEVQVLVARRENGNRLRFRSSAVDNDPVAFRTAMVGNPHGREGLDELLHLRRQRACFLRRQIQT
jgi:hypothetical protein